VILPPGREKLATTPDSTRSGPPHHAITIGILLVASFAARTAAVAPFLDDQAVAVVLRDRKASTSYVQRRLGIGYNRAASLVERMENEGLIGAANHAGKREILVGGDEAERPY